MRKLVFAGLLLSAATQAQATVYEMRDYFESLGAAYPVQSANNLWTFHNASHVGSMLAPSGANYLSAPYQQIGWLVGAGSAAWSGYGGAPSYPTFDGVFVHPNAGSATAAVFHAPEAMNISEIKLWSETVLNGSAGNGFDVIVNAVIGGVAQNIGSFVFDYPSTLGSKNETVYTPASLTLQAGDLIAILYGNRGSWLYDHGNVNVFIDGAAPVPQGPPPSVPAPGAAGLLLGGLGVVLGLTRRRARQTR